MPENTTLLVSNVLHMEFYVTMMCEVYPLRRQYSGARMGEIQDVCGHADERDNSVSHNGNWITVGQHDEQVPKTLKL